MPSFNRHNKTIIDCGFEFVNDSDSINFNVVIKCLLVVVGFLGHGGPGVWFVIDKICSPAVPNS